MEEKKRGGGKRESEVIVIHKKKKGKINTKALGYSEWLFLQGITAFSMGTVRRMIK